jgi:uncharacterized membrane protein YeaQ/YmgE (transglycosylase-associated protein family)
MIILAILLIGFFSGWLANLVLGGGTQPKDWGEVVIAGVAGSFVGGMLGSLIFEGDLGIHPSGLLGSIVGAIIVLAIWRAIRSRR